VKIKLTDPGYMSYLHTIISEKQNIGVTSFLLFLKKFLFILKHQVNGNSIVRFELETCFELHVYVRTGGGKSTKI
jgi:hypothetical protein